MARVWRCKTRQDNTNAYLVYLFAASMKDFFLLVTARRYLLQHSYQLVEELFLDNFAILPLCYRAEPRNFLFVS